MNKNKETNTEIDKINKRFESIDRRLNITLWVLGIIWIIQVINFVCSMIKLFGG